MKNIEFDMDKENLEIGMERRGRKGEWELVQISHSSL
jgi:hypothetical protein